MQRSVQGLGRVSMEKLLNPYDREYMKMAMLKHEETFKEQVLSLFTFCSRSRNHSKVENKNNNYNNVAGV